MLNNNDQENYEFAREFGRQVEKMRANFEGIYIINPENYQRFVEVYTYFRRFAEENDGKIAYLDISPESIHADVSVDVPLVDLYKGLLKEFAEILTKIDVFGITPTTTDSMLIGVSVNNVWKAVPKK